MDFVYLDICGTLVSNMLVYIQKMGINRTDYRVIVKNDSTVQKVFLNCTLCCKPERFFRGTEGFVHKAEQRLFTRSETEYKCFIVRTLMSVNRKVSDTYLQQINPFHSLEVPKVH